MKLRRLFSAVSFVLACLALLAPSPASAQDEAAQLKGRPDPTIKDIKYGLDPLQALNLFKAPSAEPAPLMIYFHGGGFTSRTTTRVNVPPPLILECLKSGISVASADYRVSPDVHFPDHFMDCARAIQFLRAHAKEYNIDPKRIAASGSSAGAGTALWIGFHDDMAAPKSDDPVLRQSTRLTCVGVQQAQTSYDPRVIKQWIGGRAAEHPSLCVFYGIQPDEVDTPKAYKLYEAASPINFLTRDDPPVFLLYAGQNKPLPPDGKPGDGIHHPMFGIKLKEQMDALKIECVMHLLDEYQVAGVRKNQANWNADKDMVAFFSKHFGLQPKPAANTAEKEKPRE